MTLLDSRTHPHSPRTAVAAYHRGKTPQDDPANDLAPETWLSDHNRRNRSVSRRQGQCASMVARELSTHFTGWTANVAWYPGTPAYVLKDMLTAPASDSRHSSPIKDGSVAFTAALTQPVAVNTDPNTGLAVDNSHRGTTAGSVYVAWTHYPDPAHQPFGGETHVAASSDHAATIKPAVTVSPASQLNAVQAAQVAVDRAGTRAGVLELLYEVHVSRPRPIQCSLRPGRDLGSRFK
jgi:hypothetical protein